MAQNGKKKVSVTSIVSNQFFIPILALVVLVLFNLVTNPGFFAITINTNSAGYQVLAGNLITVLSYGTELVFLSIGMTLVTAATGGQDISVGATMAMAASVMCRVFLGAEGGVDHIKAGTIIVAFILSVIVAMLCGAFNGALVSVFKIQPMVATLILYTGGRSIAQWINNNVNMSIADPAFKYFGTNIPGVAIPTPIIITVVVLVIVGIVMKVTNLKLYIQSVGINEKASRLNGLNPTLIKFATFIILGVFVAIAALVQLSRTASLNYSGFEKDVEMDAILAVALGGNALSGGKFSIGASVLGAYAIQLLSTTITSAGLDSSGIKAYKAVVIIILVMLSAPKVRDFLSSISKKMKGKEAEA